MQFFFFCISLLWQYKTKKNRLSSSMSVKSEWLPVTTWQWKKKKATTQFKRSGVKASCSCFGCLQQHHHNRSGDATTWRWGGICATTWRWWWGICAITWRWWRTKGLLPLVLVATHNDNTGEGMATRQWWGQGYNNTMMEGWGKASCLCLLQQGGPQWRGGSLHALAMCGFKGEKIYKFLKLREVVKATQPWRQQWRGQGPGT
jgi:hypothetical protein